MTGCVLRSQRVNEAGKGYGIPGTIGGLGDIRLMCFMKRCILSVNGSSSSSIDSSHILNDDLSE